jgi:superfamily I DNA and RNA helicase
MALLQREIDQVVGNDFKLTFTVPTPAQLERIRRINRDRTTQERSQIKKAERNLEEVLELLRQGVISAEAMPQLQDLIREMQKRKEEG